MARTRSPARRRSKAARDRHVLLVQRGTCRLFELFAAQADGRWCAGSGAIWDLRSNRCARDGWTSADAAGLPILPGLARYDEVAAGEIRHALRFTVSAHAARVRLPGPPLRVHVDRSGLPRDGPAAAAEGERRRRPASRNRRGSSRRALQRYGMLVADNGSDWYVSGAPDPRWDDDDLRALRALAGSDFEVVDTS